MSEKKIIISGQNNRYLINKIIKTTKEKRKRSFLIQDMYLNIDLQYKILNNEYNEMSEIVKQEINSKIYSYKQQDIKSNHFNCLLFITYEKVIELLKSTLCKCYYCNDNMFILYKEKNEKKQWTLDRINNEEGHNFDNVVCSCLNCNIIKKKRNHNDFFFTKNMIIDKIN